jgi:hypothetical protein
MALEKTKKSIASYGCNASEENRRKLEHQLT